MAERSADQAPARVVRRRPAVPTARALVGGLFVAGAAVLIFAAWLTTSGAASRAWVVARAPLAAGTTLSASDLTTSAMHLSAAAAAHAFSEPAGLVGRTLAAPLAAGDLVTGAALVPPRGQPALRPVAVTVDPAEMSPLAIGGLADVLVTDGSGPSARTTVVLRGARVLSTAPAGGGLGAQASGDVVTLGVPSFAAVTAVVEAQRTATVSVVVGEPSDGSGVGAAR